MGYLPDFISEGGLRVRQFDGQKLRWAPQDNEVRDCEILPTQFDEVELAVAGLKEFLKNSPYGKHHPMIDVGLTAQFISFSQPDENTEKFFSLAKQPGHKQVYVDANAITRHQTAALIMRGRTERVTLDVAINALDVLLSNSARKNLETTDITGSKYTLPKPVKRSNWLTRAFTPK